MGRDVSKIPYATFATDEIEIQSEASEEEDGFSPFQQIHVTKRHKKALKFWVSGNVAVLLFVMTIVFGIVLFTNSGNNVKTMYSDSSANTFTDSQSGISYKSTSSKPNFILILADDLGFNSIGYQNITDMTDYTPYLNAYASAGIILDNYYAQEVCTPSRAAMLTGRYPLSIGMQFGVVAPDNSWGMNLNETTIAEVLSDEGYKTHVVGKWHLGHCSPRYLPTARGFDTFTGYVDGSEYYWSKHNDQYDNLQDFLTMDKDCYYSYNGENIHNYSTWMYRDIAKEIIQEHDQSDPLFLYIAFQAVHAPFIDIDELSNEFAKGMPEYYVGEKVYKSISENIIGHRRQQYAQSLYVMDKSIHEIIEELDATDMLDNSYVIFMSDNGGCKYGGGKNGPYRGMKASLFEGGSKVDSFIYSPSFYTDAAGTIYENLFHVSDWFSTILDMAGVTYTASDDYSLDGVSHHDNFKDAAVDSDAPREYMLYNAYYRVEGYDFDKWHNGPFAVRDYRYKLIHTYNSSIYGAWNEFDEENDDDDGITDVSSDCKQSASIVSDSADFFFALYDLVSDPYEKVNIYNSTDDTLAMISKDNLYSIIETYESNARWNVDNWEKGEYDISLKTWVSECSATICPWISGDSKIDESMIDFDTSSYPSNCGSSSSYASSA